MFNITVDDSKLSINLDFVNKRMVQYLKMGVRQQGKELADFVKVRYLTGGTTTDRLGVRTGILRKSAHGLQPIGNDFSIIGGAGVGGAQTSGLVYAPVQINKPGTRTQIKAKKSGGFLAVPLRGYWSRAGAINYGRVKMPSPWDFKNLEVIKTKSGKLLLAEVKRNVLTVSVRRKGIRAGVTFKGRGKIRSITPYYLLTKQVEIKARVFPEWILQARRSYIVKNIQDAMLKSLTRKTT